MKKANGIKIYQDWRLDTIELGNQTLDHFKKYESRIKKLENMVAAISSRLGEFEKYNSSKS